MVGIEGGAYNRVQEEYEKIQEEGRQLYMTYVAKCNRLKVSPHQTPLLPLPLLPLRSSLFSSIALAVVVAAVVAVVVGGGGAAAAALLNSHT